ncbi:molybdenum cofactor guanylyltransferase [Sphingomonas guangdongensis]|uniref:Molybdenum cofactor guanylyltransferase n=1 Tax=Sphingomonas guangdongensis TaxID=1141890 RepID=A0A285QYY1_9SPHN|nr:molybdenum cofactor guanylyltransferase [Sphingomonas guangdongensis]SOB86678.1 molybdenum cofactor guanylyltransferase [Sphingomonas guangdongensis]
MRLLGALLAGGESRRFGTDKAQALLGARTLIGHAEAGLRPQVAALVRAGGGGLPDRPAPGLGPLGGLNAGLHHARAHGFDAVVSWPCDAPVVPDDLVTRLGSGGPAFVRDCPVVGYWPATLADALDAHLVGSEDRSMRSWTAAIGAVAIDLPPIANINTPADLAALAAQLRSDR